MAIKVVGMKKITVQFAADTIQAMTDSFPEIISGLFPDSANVLSFDKKFPFHKLTTLKVLTLTHFLFYFKNKTEEDFIAQRDLGQ